jgi:hypothetical protein
MVVRVVARPITRCVIARVSQHQVLRLPEEVVGERRILLSTNNGVVNDFADCGNQDSR